MTKKQALLFIASKYNSIKNTIYNIEKKYFTTKGTYHEDMTHDLYIKIYNELEKIDDKPKDVLKFLDRYYDGKVFKIYTIVKNQYINFLKREQKYIPFDSSKLNENEKKRLIQKAEDLELYSKKSIEDKVNEYVDTFYWFDKKLFNLYRYEFKQHNMNLSKATKLSESTIYRTVKRCKIKINKKLRSHYYEK